MKKILIICGSIIFLTVFIGCDKDSTTEMYTGKEKKIEHDISNLLYGRVNPYTVVYGDYSSDYIGYEKIPKKGILGPPAIDEWQQCDITKWRVESNCFTSGPILYIDEIVFMGWGNGPRLNQGLRITDGITFIEVYRDLIFDHAEGPENTIKIYKCDSVDLLLFNMTNFCDPNTKLYFEFFNPGCTTQLSLPNPCNTWMPIQEYSISFSAPGSCSASIQPFGIGGVGQLEVNVPTYLCAGCQVPYSPYYVVRIRPVGSSIWMPYQIKSYPNYLTTPFTFSNLLPGQYEIQGQNVCNSSPPFSGGGYVPAGSIVTVQ